MYTNSAYLHNSRQAFLDKSSPLIIGSCGTYHLYSKATLPTYRPKGRIDFQLLYIAAGKAHFYFQKDVEEIVTAGHMVLYRPKEMQKYIYYAEDQTEVYWIHFTGKNVNQILRKYHLPSSKKHVFYTGTSPDYQRLFRKIIQELQMCRPFYEELAAMLFEQILLLTSRQTEHDKVGNRYVQMQMEHSAYYFNEHYNRNINIESFAASRNMSTSWFIRNFKQYHGITPMKYILSIRISNAQHLLETTAYPINEIADIVGYENPLYFSRLFKKQVGISPSKYRTEKEKEGMLLD